MGTENSSAMHIFWAAIEPYLVAALIFVVLSALFLWIGFEMDNLRPRFAGIAPRFRHFMRGSVSLVLCIGCIWLISSDWIAGSLLSTFRVPDTISRSNDPLLFYLVETLLSLVAVTWFFYLVPRIVRTVRRTFRSQ
jgi:hypothetical protein